MAAVCRGRGRGRVRPDLVSRPGRAVCVRRPYELHRPLVDVTGEQVVPHSRVLDVLDGHQRSSTSVRVPDGGSIGMVGAGPDQAHLCAEREFVLSMHADVVPVRFRSAFQPTQAGGGVGLR